MRAFALYYNNALSLLLAIDVSKSYQKHAGREGSAFQSINFSHKTGNEQGLTALRNIISAENKVIQPIKGGGYYVYDKSSGMGFAISRNGLFNGFRELPKN